MKLRNCYLSAGKFTIPVIIVLIFGIVFALSYNSVGIKYSYLCTSLSTPLTTLENTTSVSIINNTKPM